MQHNQDHLNSNLQKWLLEFKCKQSKLFYEHYLYYPRNTEILFNMSGKGDALISNS